MKTKYILISIISLFCLTLYSINSNNNNKIISANKVTDETLINLAKNRYENFSNLIINNIDTQPIDIFNNQTNGDYVKTTQFFNLNGEKLDNILSVNFIDNIKNEQNQYINFKLTFTNQNSILNNTNDNYYISVIDLSSKNLYTLLKINEKDLKTSIVKKENETELNFNFSTTDFKSNTPFLIALNDSEKLIGFFGLKLNLKDNSVNKTNSTFFKKPDGSVNSDAMILFINNLNPTNFDLDDNGFYFTANSLNENSALKNVENKLLLKLKGTNGEFFGELYSDPPKYMNSLENFKLFKLNINFQNVIIDMIKQVKNDTTKLYIDVYDESNKQLIAKLEF